MATFTSNVEGRVMIPVQIISASDVEELMKSDRVFYETPTGFDDVIGGLRIFYDRRTDGSLTGLKMIMYEVVT